MFEVTASGCEYFGSPDTGDAMGTLAAGDVYRALAASATEQGGCTWLQFEKDGRTCCVALRKDRVRLYTRAATADSAAGGGLAPSAESASTLPVPRGAESGGALSMRMQQKRATAAVWENSSLILLEGEIGLELDADNNTIGQKIGNGLDVWSALPYSAGGGHVIQDSAGTELPKEGVLQFAGMEVTDDPAGGKTVVHGLGVKLADRAPVPGVPLHAVLKPVGIAPPVPPEGRADGTTITVDDETGVWSVAQAPKADRLTAARKIGEAEFDGTADITLAQMGAMGVNAIVPIAQGGTGGTTIGTARQNLHLNVMSRVLTTDSSGGFTISGLLPGNNSPILAMGTIGGGGHGWVMIKDPVKNQISGVVYKPDGTTLKSTPVRLCLLFGTSWLT